MNAYKRVGFKKTFIANRGANNTLRRSLCKEIVERVHQAGGAARILPGRCQVRINEEMTVGIVVGRSYRREPWRCCFHSLRKPDLLIVARISEVSPKVQDYFVLPYIVLPSQSWLRLSGKHYQRLESYRVTSLTPFYQLCARVPLDRTLQ
jgi:hypothetical protein